MEKRVVVTGAAGFIGSNLVHYLTKHRPDWNITVLDLLTYAGNIKNISALVDSGKVLFQKVDITVPEQVSECLKGGFDLIFHLAAESHVDRSIHDPSDFVKTNVVGTQVLLTQAINLKIPRFVHISTDEVYGSLGPSGSFTEESALDPTSPYAASKAASDLMVLAACKTHGLDAVITRCTNNYGPYQFPEKFIPLFITNALEDKKLPLYGDGLNVRSWIHVDDHCEALLRVAEKGRSGQVYNVGGASEAEVPNKAVAQIILKHLGKPESLIEHVTDRLAHDRRYSVNYAKMFAELGWQPRVRFEQGLKDTVQWYIDNQSWWRTVKTVEYLKFYEKHYAGHLSGTSKHRSI